MLNINIIRREIVRKREKMRILKTKIKMKIEDSTNGVFINVLLLDFCFSFARPSKHSSLLSAVNNHRYSLELTFCLNHFQPDELNKIYV